MSSHPNQSYSNESRLIAALCYLILLLVPIMVLATDLRRHNFLRYHGYQGLAVGIVFLIAYALVIPGATWLLLNIPCLGGAFACLAPFLYLAGIGLQIYWGYLAYQGSVFSIPILGTIAGASFND